MSNEHAPGAPLDPAEAARNRKIIRSLAIIFVVVSLFVFFWGMFVVQGTRDRAQKSDAALRSMAWTVLCYASQNDGAFPTGAGALAAARAGEAIVDGLGWPSTQAAALEGGAFVPLVEAEEIVAVTWPPNHELPPVFSVKNGVSGFGTLDLANGWLKAFAKARGEAPSAAPAAAQPATSKE